MTPADIAAALGVDADDVRKRQFGFVVHEHDGCRWDLTKPWHQWRISCIRNDGSNDTIDLKVRTTLKAAVAHVRAMLAVHPPKENES